MRAISNASLRPRRRESANDVAGEVAGAHDDAQPAARQPDRERPAIGPPGDEIAAARARARAAQTALRVEEAAALALREGDADLDAREPAAAAVARRPG